MTDPRPLPQYGEYATPEQQAAAMGKQYSPPVVTPQPAAPVPPPPLPGTRIQAGANRTDVFVSALLVAVGLYNVISQLVAPIDVGKVIQQYYTSQGIGTYAITDLTTTLGHVVTISYVVIFLLVLLFTFQRLRRGRIAWWIPLVGGVLATLVASSCAFALVLSDPAFMAYATKLGG